MKSVLLSKFQRNPKLCAQFLDTNEAPILNCDKDHYWGPGKGMFESDWDKTFDYPGTNALGIGLEGVRMLLRPAGFTRVIHSEAPMELETRNYQGRNMPAKSDVGVALANHDQVVRKDSHPDSHPTPGATAREMVKPTCVPNKIGGDGDLLMGEREISKGDEENQSIVSEEDTMERANKLLHMIRTTLGGGSGRETKMDGDGEDVLDNKQNSNLGDSILSGNYCNYSILTWNESVVVSDITRNDGRLDRDKICYMVIPTMNRSEVLEKSLMELKGSNSANVEGAKYEGGTSGHSTPVSTKFGKNRGRKSKNKDKATSGLNNKTLKMLKDLEL